MPPHRAGLPTLIIVARADRARYDLARTLLAAGSSADVVLDRRSRDRRAGSSHAAVALDRRQHPDRRSHDVSRQLTSEGWVAVQPGDGMSGPVAEAARRVDPRPVAASGRRFRGGATVLVAILLVALAVRGYWVFRGNPVLDGNGCEYARIVQNLLRDRAYVGLFEGPELMFPPLFPFLLAAGARIAGSLDLSFRVVPLLAGLLLVPAVFALTRLVYGVRVALGAAALVALHPLLVDLSSAVLSESVFLLLMVAGLYWGLRSIESGAAGHLLVCGTLFGLAYLTRPEAVLYAVVVLVAGSLRDLKHRVAVRHLARRAVCLLAPVAVLAAPYAAFLSWHT